MDRSIENIYIYITYIFKKNAIFQLRFQINLSGIESGRDKSIKILNRQLSKRENGVTIFVQNMTKCNPKGGSAPPLFVNNQVKKLAKANGLDLLDRNVTDF